ncbi:MAG: AAA family ATPase [Nitrospirae bacterium]|jgi:flagellar biosynthesis protein FlhF|nr:AAA family ATPase [Nitrospirota bacterium]MCL5062562.1 AAA family ATPase [Nitrospirota bacterium]MDA8214098.1 AAA family ATPase [Nitrospiraceae bacterium]MDA8339133.1 AAA family ATPase [Nitrospiraceae bacterium]
MKIKKFVGRSFKEALETVKKELGPDAIILSSKSVKTGPFGIINKDAVEVTAAIDESGNIPSIEKTVSSEVEDILREIRGLRDEMGFLKETLRPIVPTLRIGKDKKGLFNLLVRQGVDTQFAIILLERAQESLDSLKGVIKSDLRIQGMLPAEESGLIFLGPPGVGKTTTMSKVAHLLSSNKKHVNLISLDDNRIGSIAYMKDLSKQLKCSLKVISKVSDLPKIVYKEMGRGPILIDTPGYEYKEILEDIRDIFPSGFPVKKCFLMDASMDTHAALKAWQSCNADMIDSIGFTKLDMASQYGSLYNLSLLTSRPLSFVATGPDVPDDIRIPTPEFLAGLIVGGA